MRITVLQPDSFAPMQRLGPWLERAGATLRTVDLGEPLPIDASGDPLILLGGRADALDTHASPWLPAVHELLHSAVESGTPVLGICLGHQIIADCFGGEVSVGLAAQDEEGATQVALTDAGVDDPLLGPPRRNLDGRAIPPRRGSHAPSPRDAPGIQRALPDPGHAAGVDRLGAVPPGVLAGGCRPVGGERRPRRCRGRSRAAAPRRPSHPHRQNTRRGFRRRGPRLALTALVAAVPPFRSHSGPIPPPNSEDAYSRMLTFRVAHSTTVDRSRGISILG